MRILRLLALVLLMPAVTAHAQETEPPDGMRIGSAHLSGIDLDRLSPALRADIGKLAGTPLDRQKLQELAGRIEAEHPRHVAAIRTTRDPDNTARVVFVVARVREQGEDENINSRYQVEAVEIRGIRDDEISAELRAAIQALAGRQLVSDEADQLENRLRAALPDYNITRRTERGSQSPRVKLIFEARKADWARWLRFEPQDANLIYHSKQGWGASLPLTMSGGDVLVSPMFAFDIGDDLVEEYGGFGLRIESRRLGSERLGVFFEWSTYDQTWKDPTRAALVQNPGSHFLYRNRMSVTPLMKFAITQQLSVAGGVRITELDPLEPDDAGGLPDGTVQANGRMANAAIASVNFSKRTRPDSGPRHNVEASFTLSAGTDSLESDFDYERYVGQAGYTFRRANHLVSVSAIAGRINGEAPLFERFSLGDSRTLRGWNKYAIAPLGGGRMFHTSLEYQYKGAGVFFDAGSVWDGNREARKLRSSAGITLSPGPAFFTVGFPLNTDEFGAVVTFGVRFAGPAVSIKKY